jgi:hypothetical protein
MPSDAELREPLLERRVPWGVGLRMGGARPVAVEDLLKLARERFGDGADPSQDIWAVPPSFFER